MNKRFFQKITEKNRWKIIIVCLVAAVAIGIVVYSVLPKLNNTTTESPSVSNTVGSLNANTNNGSSSDQVNMNWVKTVSTQFQSNDFMFVMLPGADIDQNLRIEKAITTALNTIKQNGIKIDIFTFKPDDPELPATIDLMGLPKPPNVIVFNKIGTGALATGEITENLLLQTYVRASQACTPGSSCCPTK